ncbi:transposase [mine drainage metagenome]|uniref:Transposase n=1 Tax=mine drainage metagenome TaxID=410659 RepID=T0ZMS9_9ZZZZ
MWVHWRADRRVPPAQVRAALALRPAVRSRGAGDCKDEKSKQLLREMRCSSPRKPGAPLRQDYEYERAGTCNIFVAVEPRGGKRHVQVTERRTKDGEDPPYVLT